MVTTIRTEKANSEKKSFKVRLVKVELDILGTIPVYGVIYRWKVENRNYHKNNVFESLEEAKAYFNRKHSELIKKIA